MTRKLYYLSIHFNFSYKFCLNSNLRPEPINPTTKIVKKKVLRRRKYCTLCSDKNCLHSEIHESNKTTIVVNMNTMKCNFQKLNLKYRAYPGLLFKGVEYCMLITLFSAFLPVKIYPITRDISSQSILIKLGRCLV